MVSPLLRIQGIPRWRPVMNARQNGNLLQRPLIAVKYIVWIPESKHRDTAFRCSLLLSGIRLESFSYIPDCCQILHHSGKWLRHQFFLSTYHLDIWIEVLCLFIQITQILMLQILFQSLHYSTPAPPLNVHTNLWYFINYRAWMCGNNIALMDGLRAPSDKSLCFMVMSCMPVCSLIFFLSYPGDWYISRLPLMVEFR